MVSLLEVPMMQPQPQLNSFYSDLGGLVRHHDPPPYPGPAHYRPFFMPGYRQSYSGSEASTDLSLSSSENLSTSARQDPPGEETNERPNCLDPGGGDGFGYNSILSRLGMVQPPNCTERLVQTCETLSQKPVEVKTTNTSTFYVTGSRQYSPCQNLGIGGSLSKSPPLSSSPQSTIFVTNAPQPSSSPSLIYSTSPHKPQGFVHNGSPFSIGSPCLKSSIPDVISPPNKEVLMPSALTPASSIGDQRCEIVEGATDSPIPPPPEYPGYTPVSFAPVPHTESKDLDQSFDTICSSDIASCSQQDLSSLQGYLHAVTAQTANQNQSQHLQSVLSSSIGANGLSLNPPHSQGPISTSSTSLTSTAQASDYCSVAQSVHCQSDLNHAAIAVKATQMVEKLSEDNRSLRCQLENNVKKVSKLQKFEAEIQKVHSGYDALVKHSHKREKLEEMMRLRMDIELRKLKETNKELKDQLDKALSQLTQREVYNIDDNELKRELSKKDSMIVKLIAQNKELTAAKDRFEIEVTAQRTTLQEQRTHIDVLDTALANTQATVARLEEEIRRKKDQDNKVESLQKLVSQLQLTAEKKDLIEQRLRHKLQEDIKVLQGQQINSVMNKACDADEGIASDTESMTSIQCLMQQLQEKDQKLLNQEADIVKWEQKYLEESALRQIAIDAASAPKDVRIAALEQTSAETEKLIAEARTERLRHLEEVYQANRKCAELESKVKTLQAQLAEKDAMIGVLQKHSSLSPTSSVSSLLSSPVHSPRPSGIVSTPASLGGSPPSSAGSSRQGSQIDANFNASHVHAKSNSTGSAVPSLMTGKESQLRDLQHKIATQTALYRSLQSGTDQLSKRLWQV